MTAPSYQVSDLLRAATDAAEWARRKGYHPIGCIRALPDTLPALIAAEQALTTERDILIDTHSVHGEVTDPDDAAEIAEAQSLIDRIQHALQQARGDTHGRNDA